MLEIKERGKMIDGHSLDFILENGVELWTDDWNGEVYTSGYDRENNKIIKDNFVPVYRWQADHIQIEELEENTDEWCKAIEIVGFEQLS